MRRQRSVPFPTTRNGTPARLGRLLMLAAILLGLSAGLTGARAATATLMILHTSPTGDATGVPASGFISITFDRPVVSLNEVGVAGAHPAATISPAAKGTGRWINPSVWAYQVAGGLSLATRYTVTARMRLAAQDGAHLSNPYSFSFETLRPFVLSVTPTSNTPHALPGDSIQVTFNQPVQRPSAQAAFHLTADGRPVSGFFTWNDRPLSTQPNGANAVVPQQPQDAGGNPLPPPARDAVLTFHHGPLPLGAAVRVSLDAGIRATAGPLGMAAPYVWQYGVAGPLRVTASIPANGATGAALNQGVQITLSAPATQSAVAKAVRIRPKLDYQYVSLDDTGTTLNVSGDFRPSTTYTITVDSRTIGTARQHLAAPYVVRFTTQPAPPSIQLVSQGPGAVYNAYLGANIYARVTNLSSIALSLYRLTPGQFMGLITNPPNNWQGAPPAGVPLTASYHLPVKAAPDATILVKQPLREGGRALSPGYYLVDAGPGSGGGGAGDHLLVLITRTGVTLKIGQREAFVWATDLKSGKPVAGESVRIVDGKGRVFAAGITGVDGVFQAPVAGIKSDDSLLQHTLEAQLTHGRDVAACGLDWNNGVGPWDYNLPFTSYLQPVRLFLTTERPIYRPGQAVYFKGIARRDNDGRYATLPAGTPVQIQVQDGRQSTILNQRFTIDAFGAFNGKLALSPAAGLGSYTINAGIGVSNASATFQVAAYKKPGYAVSVISDRGANANYLQGEQIGVQVRARYYFGAALSHAPVKWDLSQNDFAFNSPLFPDYIFDDVDYAMVRQQTFFGQQRTEGSGTTDAHGDFHFSVPAAIASSQQSQQFTLEAIVTGPDASQVAERTQVVVHKASIYVGLRPAEYLGVAGTPNAVRVVTVSDDGARTLSGVPLIARIYRREWFSGFVRDASGFYYYQDRHRDTLVATVPVSSNAQGRGVIVFTPKEGGEYRVVTTASDPAGRRSTSAISLWVASNGAAYVPWQTQNNDRIRLVADRASYKPGETARILVTAPLAGMTALITVERGGVLSHRVITLPTNSSQIGVPIRGDYAPDVYVGVTLVKGPGTDTAIPVWKMGYVALPVDTSARSLHIALSASPPGARPGQRVTFTIYATDAQGTGVQAQLAVGLVDKAVLALATAAGTGVMDTFYQKRDLGVESAGSFTLYIDRLNLNQKVGSKGGSGGGGSGIGPTRQHFPDTAYWNPSVVTDTQGHATVSLILPDNLTTWTLSAIGGTAGTQVGQATLDLISSKSLLLVPAVPRFVTVGDTAAAGAVVDNLTAATQRVRVALAVSGAGPAAGYAATVTVPAGGSRLVQWPVHATTIGTQTYLFSAQADGNAALGDRLQVSLPVQANSIAKVDAASGLVHDSVTQTVMVPSGAQRDQGGLTITLAPSLVSGLGGAVDALQQSAYESLEGTVSRLYAISQVTRIPRSISGISAATTAQAPASVEAAIQELYNTQNGDGGWGWWQEDSSSPFITAYVLEGLSTLRGRNHTVDGKVLKAAIGYLRGWALNPPVGTYLPDATSTRDLQAYSAYVLGEVGAPDAGLIGSLYGHRQNMLPFARTYLALATARIAGSGDPRIRDLLASVEASAQQFGSQAHWSDSAPDWQMMDEDVTATGAVLDALVRLDRNNPLIAPAVRWLMARRIDRAWPTTRGTAIVLRALADYASRETTAVGASHYTVLVNGKTVGGGAFTGTASDAVQTVMVPIAALSARSAITIRRQGGAGQLAYTLTLRSYEPITTVPATEHGISISRRYEPIGGGAGRAGSELRVVLTITAPEDLYYLAIEDPLPAGAEPVDTSLRITSVLSGITAQTTIPRGTSELGWYVSHVEFRDDRTALFADMLPAGVYQYSYQLHLTSAGTYHALPTQAHLLYFPEVSGHGAGGLYTISPN